MTSFDPVTSWTAWDVSGDAPTRARATNVFARSPRQGSGAEERYELIAVTARGFRPPRFLGVVDCSEDRPGGRGEEAVGAADSDLAGFKQAWSLLYRRVTETAPAVDSPYAIYLLGVNPPAGATLDELDVFNDFYTKVHLPEVAERHHALRAVRHELVRAVRPPHQGAPQFLAVYELDEQAASIRRHVGPPYATGPAVWQHHTTPWRLWYRRLALD